MTLNTDPEAHYASIHIDLPTAEGENLATSSFTHNVILVLEYSMDEGNPIFVVSYIITLVLVLNKKSKFWIFLEFHIIRDKKCVIIQKSKY